MKWMLPVLLCACGESPEGSSPVDSGVEPDAVATATCTTGDPAKISFTRDKGCANDGSVEFCLPATDQAVRARVTAISSSISCAPGGGRAMCNDPGLVLCMFPTAFPTHCEAVHGAMTGEVWTQMCSLSAIDEIHQILPTLAE